MKKIIIIGLMLIAKFAIAQQIKIMGTLSVEKVNSTEQQMQIPSNDHWVSIPYYKVTLASEGKVYDVLRCASSEVNTNNDQSKQYLPLWTCYLRIANALSLNGHSVKVEGQVVNNYILSAKLFDTANNELPILDITYTSENAATIDEFYTKELKIGTSFPLTPQQLNKTAKAIWSNFSYGQPSNYQDDECKSNSKLKKDSEYYYHIVTGDRTDDLNNLKCDIRVDSRRSNDTNDVSLRSLNKYYYKWNLIKLSSAPDLKALESLFDDLKKELINKYGQPTNDKVVEKSKNNYSADASFNNGSFLSISISYKKKMLRGEVVYRGCK